MLDYVSPFATIQTESLGSDQVAFRDLAYICHKGAGRRTASLPDNCAPTIMPTAAILDSYLDCRWLYPDRRLTAGRNNGR